MEFYLMLCASQDGRGIWGKMDTCLSMAESLPWSPKGDQSWVYIGGTDVEADTLILWPPDSKSWLIWKDSDAGKDWGKEEKGTTEDEMAGWHHRLNGYGFEWTPGVVDGQGGLACCGSWGCKESDTTERLNWSFKAKFCKSKACFYADKFFIVIATILCLIEF